MASACRDGTVGESSEGRRVKQFLSFEPSRILQGFNGFPPLAGIGMMVPAKCGCILQPNSGGNAEHFRPEHGFCRVGVFFIFNYRRNLS